MQRHRVWVDHVDGTDLSPRKPVLAPHGISGDVGLALSCPEDDDERHTLSYADNVDAFRWNAAKNLRLRSERGVCFEDVVAAIAEDRLLDILEHRNPARYPRQKLLVVRIRDYAYLVPYIEEADCFFLKTIIPSRKATRIYVQRPSA